MSAPMVTLHLNGKLCVVPSGVTVVAAMALHQILWNRRSTTGKPRAAMCGIGVCFECRVTIDGVTHQRACQTRVHQNMTVTTDDQS